MENRVRLLNVNDFVWKNIEILWAICNLPKNTTLFGGNAININKKSRVSPRPNKQ